MAATLLRILLWALLTIGRTDVIRSFLTNLEPFPFLSVASSLKNCRHVE